MIAFRAAEIGVEAMRRLSAVGTVEIARGLRDAEVDLITARYGFTFADDHRAFLMGGCPIGSGWPDWRSPDQRAVRDQLAWPVEGTLFDVEHRGFWYRGWGRRPTDPDEVLDVAAAALLRVPQMVPLRGNRYLPAGAGCGHPVLAMFRSEITESGADLVDWVDREFAGTDPTRVGTPTVEFWSELI